MKNEDASIKKIMPKSRLFFDSSVIIAGILSSTGAARALMFMSEQREIDLYISEHVVIESERSMARKVPEALPQFRKALKDAKPIIIESPSTEEVGAYLYMISDPDDAPILTAAIKAKADFLVTHNRRHFLDDQKVVEKSGLRIGTPGEALVWISGNL